MCHSVFSISTKMSHTTPQIHHVQNQNHARKTSFCPWDPHLSDGTSVHPVPNQSLRSALDISPPQHPFYHHFSSNPPPTRFLDQPRFSVAVATALIQALTAFCERLCHSLLRDLPAFIPRFSPKGTFLLKIILGFLSIPRIKSGPHGGTQNPNRPGLYLRLLLQPLQSGIGTSLNPHTLSCPWPLVHWFPLPHIILLCLVNSYSTVRSTRPSPPLCSFQDV